MDCLNNRIGILGYAAGITAADLTAVPPVDALPVLFINQLPGVSLQKMTDIADEEQETFIGVWNDVVLRTMKKFEVLVKAELNNCYKITDKIIVECLICAQKELFDVALWYLHGTELMIEITSSDTLNRWTTVDLEKAERLKEDFYGEFKAALKDAVQGISPQDSDCISECIQCNDNLRWVTQLP